MALLVRPTTAAASTVKVDAYHTTILTTPTTDRVQAGIRDAADGTPLTQPLPSYPAGTLAFGASWTTASNPPVPSDADASDSGAYAAALYQLLQFAIVPDDFVDGSGWSQPLGPNGTADAWSYQRAAPVQRFVKNAPATPNRYIAIGHTTKLDLQLVDVYGNAQALAPLNVTPVYNDPLIPIDEWPGTTAQFAFAAAAAGSATLTIDVAFDPAQVQHKDVALLQYQTVADQLTDPRTRLTVTSALAAGPVKTDQDARGALAGLVAQIVAYLAPESPGPAPAPVTLTATLPTAYAGQIGVDMFPVWVSIETVRDAPGNGKYPDGFLSVTAQVVPRLGADTDKDAALAAWAGDFETAFAGFDGKGALLKVLSGSPPSKVKATASTLGATAAGDVTSVPGDLWALRWSPTAGVAVEFGNAGAKPADAAPVYFTPMPLATQLAGGVVDIVSYDSSGNPLANPVSTTYSGVDLDMWARSFLSAVDSLLAPDLASAIARLDPTSYAALMTAKEDIAYAISASVSWVFADQMPPKGGGAGAGDLTAAQTVFRESLLTSLATDFATSAIVQVPATVSVNGPFEQGADGRAPELFGSPTPPGKNMTGQYTFTSATLPAVAGTGSLTFLAEVVHPTQQADLCLPFAYDVGFVDHRFQTSAEQFGYVPSSWLRFVLPNSDPGAPPDPVLNVPMGQLDIPVPLRAYPSPPRLVSQAITGASAPATLAAAVTGTYSLAVGTPSVAQDDLHLAVLFNGAPVPTGDTTVGGGNPLFAPLASFQDFQANYLDTARTAIATGAPTAKQWLADVLAQVQQVATAWQGGDAEEALFADAGDGTPPPPAPFTWGFVLWVQEEATNVVRLRWTDATESAPDAAWPQIDGISGTVVDASTRSYTLPSLPPELTLTWPGLSVVTHQQISTAAWIVRNEELGGGCAGAVEHGETNPGLVYRTPVVTFQDPVVPLLEVPGTITVTSSSLTDATGQLVSGLMTPTSPAAQVGWGVDAAYSFTLVNGAPGTLDTRLPIFLARASVSTVTPPPPVNVDTIASLSAKLKGELATWYGSFSPGAVNARLLFSLTLFAAGTEQPILRLTDVEAPIAGAAWWQS